MCFQRGGQIRFQPLTLGGSYLGAYGAEPPETREEAGRRMPASL
jgi:hypothetical protein